MIMTCGKLKPMEKNQNKITEDEVQVLDDEVRALNKEIALFDKAKKKDYFLPASIIIAGMLIAGAVIFAIMYKGGSSTGGSVAQQSAATSTADVMKVGGRDIVLGDASAPVTIVEYSDYQCPYCGKFFTETQPLIVQNYVNTGKVRMVFRNFPFLGPESTAAAEAAECAEDQNQGVGYHDALFGRNMLRKPAAEAKTTGA